MRKGFIILVAGFMSVFTANAQLKKIAEFKLDAMPPLAITNDGNNYMQAGTKVFEVIDVAGNKIKLNKSYKEAGAGFEKAFDASFDDSDQVLIVCDDAKTVSCIDLATGKQLWENKGFIELGSDKSASSLDCSGNVVIVTDKKAKDNYTLTCLDLKTGKQTWAVENLPAKINTNDIEVSAGMVCTRIYMKKEDKTYFKFYNIASGKADISAVLEGSSIASLELEDKYMFIHHRVSEKKSFLTAFDLVNKKQMWTSPAANLSPNLPMVMNTNVIRYYATIKSFGGKVLLITEGIEAFDIATGKAVYNLPFVPYYKWGVGHYIDAIFSPVITEKGILLADATQGDIFIRYYDGETGKQLWSSEKQKKKNVSPMAYVVDGQAVIQFGGTCVFEVMNNSEIGKFLDPYEVTAFDLKTGRINWTMEIKNAIYTTELVKGNIMVVDKKELKTIDLKTGSILKTEDDPFDDSYFRTKVGLSVTKFQKGADIDFERRMVFRGKDDKLIISTF